ncbi:MAG TPA: universal stress protein [Blastocatellia bacterium]|nr:universal stress protein [Blastocatellia bacterium]
MSIQDILIPLDFSPNSLRAIDFALTLAAEGEICLLHVIDSDFVRRLSDEGFGEAESAIGKLRQKAEQLLAEVVSGLPQDRRIESMVVVGKPFSEILRVAVDLDFQAIVMGIGGRRGDSIEELLFGSTADKVIRGTRVPVICVPEMVA